MVGLCRCDKKLDGHPQHSFGTGLLEMNARTSEMGSEGNWAGRQTPCHPIRYPHSDLLPRGKPQTYTPLSEATNQRLASLLTLEGDPATGSHTWGHCCLQTARLSWQVGTDITLKWPLPPHNRYTNLGLTIPGPCQLQRRNL